MGTHIMPIQTLRRLTDAEMNSPSMKERMDEFTAAIKKRYDDESIPTGDYLGDDFIVQDDPTYEKSNQN